MNLFHKRIILIGVTSCIYFNCIGQKGNYFTQVLSKDSAIAQFSAPGFNGYAIILRRRSILPRYYAIELTPITSINVNSVQVKGHFFLKKADKNKMALMNQYVRSVYRISKQEIIENHLDNSALYFTPFTKGDFVYIKVSDNMQTNRMKGGSVNTAPVGIPIVLNPSPPAGIINQ